MILYKYEKLIAKQRELIKLLDTEPDDYNREIDGKESKLRKEIAELEKEIENSINKVIHKGTIPLSKEWENEIILSDWKHLPADKYKDDSEWHVPNKDDLISLAYYPKEFVEWRINQPNDWYYPKSHNLDETYKFWNENIRQ
jgi:hypothetical protein